MSKPVHQHFIPRSYLNNFGSKKDDKVLINAKLKNEDEIKIVSTKDICVNKNLYTLPEKDGQNKFALENFYADQIDGKFPEIYDVLSNPEIDEIDIEMKTKIISVALSLYFRTPKFLNQENKIFEELVRSAHAKSKGRDIIIEYAGESIIISPEEVDQIVKEQKENNRIKFLSHHLQSFKKFVESKLTDTIYVYHIVDDSELITSDNPVFIRPYGNPFDENFDYEKYYSQDIDPFEKTNTIHVPLDRKTILTILPNLDDFPTQKIRRLKKLRFDTVLYNSDIEKYAERWILGSELGLITHIRDQHEFNNPSKEIIVEAERYKEKTSELYELMNLIEKNGVRNKEVYLKAKYMENLKSVKDDPNFKNILKVIKAENKENYN